MNPPSVTLPLAFVAGLLSFVSPCVLPLVPAYLGYLGGTTVLSDEQAGRPAQPRRAIGPFLHGLLFVLGFATVFVLLGASATALGRVLFDYRLLLARVGGVLLVVFGFRLMGSGWSRRRWIAGAAAVAVVTLGSGLLFQGVGQSGERALILLEESLMMGLVVLAGANPGIAGQVVLGVAAGGLNLLASYDELLPTLIASVFIAAVTVFFNRADIFYAERRLGIQKAGQSGLGRSYLFGVIFAAGWTPCIGPILTAILVVASQLQTVWHGILLLVAYSLGLGIPFLLVGVAFGPLSSAFRRMNRHLGIVSIVSGALLVLMGILIFTDSLSFLAGYGDWITIRWQ